MRRPGRRARALVLAGLVLVGVFLARERLLGPLIIQELEDAVSTDLGLRLSIGAAGGSYLDGLELRDIALEPAPELGLERVAIERLEVEYSLLGLVRGRLDAVTAIRARGVDLSLDLGAMEGASAEGRWVEPPLSPEVEMRGVHLRLTHGDHRLELEDLALVLPAGSLLASNDRTAELRAGRTTLDVALPALAGQVAAGDVPAVPADRPAPWTLPAWRADLRRRGDLLEVLQLSGGDQVLVERAALGLAAAWDGQLELDVRVPLPEGQVHLRYAAGAVADHVVLDVAALALTDLGRWARRLGWLPASAQGSAVASLLDGGLLDLEADLDLMFGPEFEVDGVLALHGRGLLDRDGTSTGSTGTGAAGPSAAGPSAGPPSLTDVEGFDLEMTLEPGGLVLTRGEVVGPGGEADLAGTRLTWGAGLALDLSARARFVGESFPAGRPVVLAGQAAFLEDGAVAVDTLVASVPEGRVELDDLRVELEGTSVLASLVRASVETTIDDVRADLDGVALHWDGDAELLSAELEDARLSLRGQPLTLVAPARVSYSRDRLVAIESLRLEGAGGELSLTGGVDVGATEADLRVVAHDLHPTGLLRVWIPELPDYHLLESLEVELRGPPGELVTSASLRVLGLEGPAPLPFDLELRGRHGPGALTLEHLRVSAEGHPLLTGRGEVGLREGWLDLQGGALQAELTFALERALELVDEAPLRAERLGGRLVLGGTWARPEASLSLQGVALGPPGVDLPEQLSWPDLQAEMTLEEGSLVLDGFTLGAGVGELVARGRCLGLVSTGSDARGWPTVSLEREAVLEGRLDLTGVDGGRLLGVIPGLRRAAGRIEAHLELDGTLGAPRLGGPVSLSDGELALEGQGLASLADLQGTARVRAELEQGAERVPGPRLFVEDIALAGELGAAPLQVRGALGLQAPEGGGGAPRLVVDLSLDGQELLLFRSGGVKLRADTRLELQGPWEAMTLGGTVAITDGRMTRHLSLFDLGGESAPISVRLDRLAATEPPWSDVRLDVSLTTARPMAVSSSLLRSRVVLDAHLGGTGADPELSGSLVAEDSRIALPLWTFASDRASVQFDRRSLLLSEVAGTARARILGYDVLVVLSGPLEEPEVRLSSLPPLGEEDLVSLVLTGQLPQDGAFSQESRVLSGMAIYLGKDLLTRAFGDESTEGSESFIERFEVESGRNQSRTGSESLDVRFRMVDDVFTDDDSLYLEVEQSEFDETNGSLRLVFRLR